MDNIIKLGEKNLIISFASIGLDLAHVIPIFEFGRSLSNMNLPSDVLFMKDESKKWYLGGLKGIGKNIDHTIAFLKNEIQNYDRVICIGTSAGGYASILFGSLINAQVSISFIPQTDLNYTRKRCMELHNSAICNSKLYKLKTFKKYNNLNTVINSTTKYFINTLLHNNDFYHALHHYENISEFSNISKLDHYAKTMIKNGELEKLLKSLMDNGGGLQ